MDITPVVLEGQHVRLEPLTVHHVEAFCEAAREWNLRREQVRGAAAGTAGASIW